MKVKINNVGWKLMVYLIVTMISLVFLSLMLVFFVSCLISYFKISSWDFRIDDIVTIVKGSLGGGGALGIGIWLISKKEEKDRKLKVKQSLKNN